MMRFHLFASFVLVLTLATSACAYGAQVNAEPNRGADILKRSAHNDDVTTTTLIVPTTDLTTMDEDTITNVTNITHVPTGDDDEGDKKKKKKEREPVRDELWGIIMSVVGFLIVSAMTGTLWFMARKKKRIEAKRKEAALLAPVKK